jgi:hypothetical protein
VGSPAKRGIAMKLLRLLVICVLAAGCKTVDIPKYYVSQATEKYGPVEDAMLFFYVFEDINEMYALLFSGYRIIGKSTYHYRNYRRGAFNHRIIRNFAKSVGADILITAQRRVDGESLASGSVLERLFLKNVNRIKPVWEMGKEDFPFLEEDPVFHGQYIGEGNVVELFRSGDKILGFAVNEIAGRKGRLLYSFEADSGTGFYMAYYDNKKDFDLRPCNFRINALGYLEVKRNTQEKVVTYLHFLKKHF